MSLSWFQRKTRLATLLKSQGDEEEDGVALDRIIHGQTVIGKTSKTLEIDTLRFKDKDLTAIGTLEYGQFGVIYVVSCHLDGRVYVRKSIEKRFAFRNRDQVFPQSERDVLLRAAKTGSPWAPHLLCAFQTPTHLNLIMDYAEGGNLWDVLESSPHNGKISESDLKWWTPQIVSAIHWCHSQGFVHRDIKPHNFVLSPTAHVLLVDFGSAASLLPPDTDGVQFVPRRYCRMPCGTCDYISPEILKAHETALVALEMNDVTSSEATERSYGRETDWWSLGAMLYEMVFGYTPFFAKDIRQTYLRIMDHERSLYFDRTAAISPEFREFIASLLTRAEKRPGRHYIDEITDHTLFKDVDWMTLPTRSAPSDLHRPQFTYAEPANLSLSSPNLQQHYEEDSHSQGFNFSALFQSSVASSSGTSAASRTTHQLRISDDDNTASFIGFSWGPVLDAFPNDLNPRTKGRLAMSIAISDSLADVDLRPTHSTPRVNSGTPRLSALQVKSHPDVPQNKYMTPMRHTTLTPFQTLQRTGTVQRTAMRRDVSDREAMKQLVDCVGMSARKKVLESGRKPKLLTSFNFSGGSLKMKPGFVIPPPNYEHTSTFNFTTSGNASSSFIASTRRTPGLSGLNHDAIQDNHSGMTASGSEDTTDSEGPPSPSPTPRPGSSMSMLSVRRASTPTASMPMNGMVSGMGTALLGLAQKASEHRVTLIQPTEVLEREMESGMSPEDVAIAVREGDTPAPSVEGMERRLAKLVYDVRDLEARLGKAKEMVP